MRFGPGLRVVCLACGLTGTTGAAACAQAAVRPLSPWLADIASELSRVERQAAAGRLQEARQAALRLYLDQYEMLESAYAGGGGGSPVQAGIGAAEERFHELLRARDAGQARALAAALRTNLISLERLALSVPAAAGAVEVLPAGVAATGSTGTRPDAAARTPELRRVLSQLDSARAEYDGGRLAPALGRVERMYLEGIEPLEARLPQDRVHEIERLVHLGVRAGIGQRLPARVVDADFARLRDRLLEADALLGAGAPAWLGATNAFIILVREGLEAVLLVAALLAYLAATDAGRRARRQIYTGVVAGVAATLATWGVASVLIPIGGGSRELVEGVTGLLAVAVLVYVSNWLFQKTYIHDWKDYLRQHVGKAVSTGSALAMASLAFAAVYREGFETVLFYRALLFDAGPWAVLAGALPGALVIGMLGVAIIRLGVKLPLKRVFATTNGILLYLAFTFVGKGLYNLQEAGVFAPHPLRLVPDSMILRQLLGIYPVLETLAAQALFVAGVGATYLYYRRRMARRATYQVSAPATSAAAATLHPAQG
ncbi:MAG TPA: FTR1 family protein [Longimicrobiales bacterium]